jgi:Secretion system C-terminal sorting domain
MKRVVLPFSALLLAAPMKAQLPDGYLAPDFTATDLSGNTHVLSDILAQGKTVIMDISATWCSPCWSFHNSGVLEDVWELYGPDGTDEMMVLFVEGDGSTNLADLQGNTQASQGNWIQGTQYPIIDNAGIADDYQISYFPTVYGICPAGVLFEVGTLNNATAYHNWANSCPEPTYAVDPWAVVAAEIDVAVCGGQSTQAEPMVSVLNFGTQALTDISFSTYVEGALASTHVWTGPLGVLEMAEVQLPGVTVMDGDEVTVTITNAGDGTPQNNSVEVNANVNAFGNSLEVVPFTEDWTSSQLGANGWVSLDLASDGPKWKRVGQGIDGNTGSAKMDFYSSFPGQKDDLISAKFDLSAMTNAALTFKWTKANYANEPANDKLQVRVSNDCGESWEVLWTKSGSELDTEEDQNNAYTPSSSSTWETATVELSEWDGAAELLVSFYATSDYGNNLFLDNINIASAPVGIAETVGDGGLRLYPNPTSGLVNLAVAEASGTVQAQVFNGVGQVVGALNFSAAGTSVRSFDMSAMENGVYYVLVRNGERTYTQKITLAR